MDLFGVAHGLHGDHSKGCHVCVHAVETLFFLHQLLSICTLAKKINEVHNFLRPLWEPVFQHRLLTFCLGLARRETQLRLLR